MGYGAVCSVVEGCLVCGDAAVEVTVVEPGEQDAVCEDRNGGRGLVGVDLVGPVVAGDHLLVHGGVAISRFEAAQ
jgi:hydrogenase maturation factor